MLSWLRDARRTHTLSPSFQKMVPNSRATPMEKLNRVALYSCEA